MAENNNKGKEGYTGPSVFAHQSPPPTAWQALENAACNAQEDLASIASFAKIADGAADKKLSGASISYINIDGSTASFSPQHGLTVNHTDLNVKIKGQVDCPKVNKLY